MCTQPRRNRVGSHCLRCHKQTDDGNNTALRFCFFGGAPSALSSSDATIPFMSSRTLCSLCSMLFDFKLSCSLYTGCKNAAAKWYHVSLAQHFRPQTMQDLDKAAISLGSLVCIVFPLSASWFSAHVTSVSPDEEFLDFRPQISTSDISNCVMYP